MKFRLFTSFAAAAVLLAGCAVEEAPMAGGSIAAVMEDIQTRTAVTDEGIFTWSSGDKVWLEITANPGYVTGTLSSGAGTGSANFSYGTYFGDMTGKAVYPFNAGHDINGDELSVVLPASYDLGTNLSNTNAAMYGVETNGSIKFNHLAGVMRFKFRNAPAGTDRFILTLDKKINGTFTADLTEDHPVLQTESTSDDSEKSITLNFDALTSVQDIMLYVPLPLGTYTTLGLEVKAGSQSVWSYSNTVTNTINRKSLILMPTVTLAGSISGDIEGSETPEDPSEPDSSQPSYSVQLNPSTYGWQQSTSVSNPDASLYDGVYESTNGGVHSSCSLMYIDISGYDNFKLYVRSYAESNFDFVVVSNLDCTLTQSTVDGSNVKMTTKGNQKSGTSISNYSLVEFTGIGGGDHRITVMYRKDGSENNGSDKGYVLIPKNQNQGSQTPSSTDLSSNGTANSYIVSESGSYSFSPTKGNSSESVGAISSVEVLWETFGTSETPSVGSLISSVSYADGKISFSTPESYREGNAVIAAKDANGTILWSWHIWLTDEPEGQVYYNNAGTMMDRNLGATSATPGDVGALGLLYQWGRKDPFLGSSSISSSTVAKSTLTWPSAVSSDSSNGTIDYAVEHPTTFITSNSKNYDWYYTGSSSTDNTRWQSSKTIYDPCPAGWRVPDGGRNGVWSTALGSSSDFDDDSLYDSSNAGMNFSGWFGSASTIWYPAPGHRHCLDGSLYNVSNGYNSGYYWSASPIIYHAYYLVFRNDGVVYPTFDYYRAEGFSVRCLQE